MAEHIYDVTIERQAVVTDRLAIQAESPQHAVAIAREAYPNHEPIAVDDLDLIGKCCLCHCDLIEGDFAAKRNSLIYCEDCIDYMPDEDTRELPNIDYLAPHARGWFDWFCYLLDMFKIWLLGR